MPASAATVTVVGFTHEGRSSRLLMYWKANHATTIKTSSPAMIGSGAGTRIADRPVLCRPFATLTPSVITRVRDPHCTWPSVQGWTGDAHAAEGGATVAVLLALQVERADPLARLDSLLVEPVGRHQPDDLELDSVRVVPVQALRRPVVGGPDEGTGRRQRGRRPVELLERVDLPGEVVQAHRAAPCGAGPAAGRAGLEEPEVVVVGRPGRPQERRPGEAVRRHVDR